ncbi:MAG: SGNH/GDSL hydrolase family protein [Leptolyngbya sp. RL_3_1]|nr:SGNH/GDSL hydrolase family protein [Leptolyngbya sp. RL_3_1]
MKLVGLVLGLLLLLLVASEVLLRLIFGFGTPPLYVADAEVGYRLAPHQRLRRFGNRIEINEYSMRGPVISPERSPQTFRVLLIGDSIANGGWWTDQPHILSLKMQTQLQTQLPAAVATFNTIEVLNASANSWGPRNELAYLDKFGTFEAQVVVVLINTDDLFATAPTALPVGRTRNYPDRAPALAWMEVLSRFRQDPPFPELEAVQAEGGDRVGHNLTAIQQIQQRVTGADGQLILAMTPLLREVEPPGPRDYEQVARQRLQAFAAQHTITYIDFLDPFQSHNEGSRLYRDHIHLSSEGNDLVSTTLTQTLSPLIKATAQE